MKCKNCSWPNRPGEKNCIKCGAPLTEDSSAPKIPSGHNPTVVNSLSGARPSPHPRKDQAPTQPLQPQQPQPQQQPQPLQPLQPQPVAPVNPNVCPRCNYPLRPGMAECPNCLYQLTPMPRPARPAAPASPGNQPNPAAAPASGGVQRPAASHRPTVVGLPEVEIPAGQENPQPAAPATPNAPKHFGTINVYTAAATETTPKFSLTPVQKVNEPSAPADLKFEGQEAILNRANTDPGNLSITSRQQASIARRGGKWMITDLSDQQTTFVHPSKEGQELHEGDIILLGNRLFIFHE